MSKSAQKSTPHLRLLALVLSCVAISTEFTNAQEVIEVPSSQSYPLGNSLGQAPPESFNPNPAPEPRPAEPEVDPFDPEDFSPRDTVAALANAYALALVDLKLREVELITGLEAEPAEANQLALVQAKIETIEAELRELTVAHLRRQRMKLTEVFRPSHPRVMELDAKIADRLKPMEATNPTTE